MKLAVRKERISVVGRARSRPQFSSFDPSLHLSRDDSHPLLPIHHLHLSAVMASPALPRLAMRQSRLLVQRRAASTTTEASQAASKGATAAKETAQSTASKAQEGLSKVTSSAGPAISKAASSVTNSLSRVGGRTGAAINWVQGKIYHAHLNKFLC